MARHESAAEASQEQQDLPCIHLHCLSLHCLPLPSLALPSLTFVAGFRQRLKTSREAENQEQSRSYKSLSATNFQPLEMNKNAAAAATAAAATAPLLFGSANLPPNLSCFVSGSAFEAAVNEIEAGRYPDMHLVYSSSESSARATSNALSSAAANYGGVRVYVGSQAAAGVPDKSGKPNLEQWKAQKLAELQQSRISVILCCCNDGATALWRPFESSGIRFAS
jgi:hypothetical protein